MEQTAVAALGPPPGPFPGSLPRRGRPGQNRLPVEEPPQVVGQFERGRVPAARLLLQTLQADNLQVAGRVTLKLAGRKRLLLETCSIVESGVVPLNGGRPVSIS